MENEVPDAGLYNDSDPELLASPPRLHQHHHHHRKRTSFLAGFRDCHQEVLRYLVGVEQVPIEGAVVFGLEQHLTDLETSMQASIGCDDRPRQGVLGGAEVPEIVDGYEEEYGTKENNNTSIDESGFDSGFDSSLVGPTNGDPSTDVVGGSEETRLADDEADDERLRADDAIDESELAENALELMHLANGNPRISRILNELFALMDSDYYDDDDDDDDDDGVEMEEADGINLQSQDD